MFSKLEGVVSRMDELNDLLMDPKVLSDRRSLQKYGREANELRAVVDKYNEYKRLEGDIQEAKQLLSDPSSDSDMKELAKGELEEIEPMLVAVEAELRQLLLPKDPLDDKNIFIEIRAGTGGDESSLFVADMLRMYERYAEMMRWKLEIVEVAESDVGGYKEVIATVRGESVYSHLKFEAGTHRVQRIPTTEASGRIHTSACTVAIIPEPDDIEVEINDSDLKVDTFRASGAGGQHVNTTDSAVRITHSPTGIVVSCQDERSQIKNRDKAMKILKARIFDAMIKSRDDATASTRKQQVGSGDRSERIRTYNFPQNRLTDHRINLTLHSLDKVMVGELHEVVNALISNYRAEMLKSEGL